MEKFHLWKFDFPSSSYNCLQNPENFCRKIESRSRSSIASVTVLNFSSCYFFPLFTSNLLHATQKFWTENETSNSLVCFIGFYYPECCIWVKFKTFSVLHELKRLPPLKTNYSTQFAANVTTPGAYVCVCMRV